MTLMSYRQKRRLIAPESKMIRRFIVASNALEQYLCQGGALKPVQSQTIGSALMSLLTVFQRSADKHADRPKE
jgi:hypothetical protein